MNRAIIVLLHETSHKLEKCVNVIINALGEKNVQNIVFVINLCVTDICTILAHVIFLQANVKFCLFSPLVSRQITEERHMGWQIVLKQRIHSLSESF